MGSEENRVAILRPGRNCWRVAEARRASTLIDAAAYFEALSAAFERATRSIVVLGWDFDGGITLDPRGRGPASRPLREYLPDLLDRAPDLELRILVWRNSVFYGESQSAPPQVDPHWSGHERMTFRFANEHPVGACHHEKIVCVDDSVAFVGGQDLTARRWDVTTHDPGHPVRIDASGRPYGPRHDVQLVVDGATAASLAELARGRWVEATGESLPPVEASCDPWPPRLPVELRDVLVGITRTRPESASTPEIREAEQLTLDALRAARNHVYVESQYLTSEAVADCLAEGLSRPDGPDIVLVVRLRNDGFFQRLAMGENRDRLLRRLVRADRHGRLGAYHPVVLDMAGGDHDIDVHSKVIAIDDRLLRIGSSNLNNRSMGFDTECDLVVEANDEQASRALRSITCRLIGEHVGGSGRELAGEVDRLGLLGAVEVFNVGERRRLVPFNVGEDGPQRPVLGTSLIDPKGHLW